MSHATTDEQTTALVTDLRRRADAAPHTTWDVPAVITAGRRHRRLRTARRSTGAVAVVLACAVVLPVLVDRAGGGTVGPAVEPTPTPTVLVEQEPRQVEVAPGVVASVGAARRDGSVALGRLAGSSAWLTSDDGGTLARHAALHLEGPRLTGWSGIVPLSDGSGATLGAMVLDTQSNPAGDAVQLDPATGWLSGLATKTERFDPARGLVVLHAGAAPASLRDARVFLYAYGLVAADGDGLQVVEIPTFAVSEGLTADGADAARWFAVEAIGPATSGLVTTPDRPTYAPGGFAFAGSDGTIVVPGCTGVSEVTCEQRIGPGLYDDIRTLLAGPPAR